MNSRFNRTPEQEAEYKRRRNEETRKLNETLKGRWDQVLPRLIPEISPAVDQGHTHHITCPFHGGVNDFRIFADFADSGGAICSCGEWSDGWALLMHARHCSFFDAKKLLLEALGGSFDASNLPVRYVPTKDPDAVAKKDEFNKSVVQNTWSETLPLTDERASPVRRWFFNRQLHEIKAPLNNVRYHPALEYFDKPKGGKGRSVVTHVGPAMVAMLTNVNGRTSGLHRTWLTPDGQKAPVESVRRLTSAISTHPITGSAVKFDTLISPILQVGEGIESSLAARAITGFPTWSCINKALMTKLEVPDHVKFVIVWADRDLSNTGQAAAGELVQRLRASGRKAVCLIPPFSVPGGSKSVDWNDVVRAVGLEGARELEAVKQVLEPLKKMVEEYA